MKTEQAEICIGLPRAFLYHRYEVLWHTFFETLGVKTIVSPQTTKSILEEGSDLAIDETCLSSKIFLGHVKSLIGKCDYIFVPRMHTFGRHRDMCTKFEALYDLTANTFRGSGQKFLCCNIDMEHNISEEQAYLTMGQDLGFSRREVRKAFKRAKKAEAENWKRLLKRQEERYKTDKVKILIAAHSYVIEDAYIGKPIAEMLKRLGVVPLRGDLVDRREALEQSRKISPTMKWEVNREIAGSIRMNRKRIDGIILLSVFPCGPDSMTNEMMIRRNPGIPILNLTVDAQNGLAGMETRLESFVDIINFKRGNPV